MNSTAELKSVTRTRNLVNLMLWIIVAGAVFYSAMTSTPLVSEHSPWSWSGWALGLLTDAAFVLALSADATLSKHGLNGGRWPTVFRWATGLASLFLNCWSSVDVGDWVGVAIHSISPVILVCAAEVAPIYRRKFRELELHLSSSGSIPASSGSPVQLSSRSMPVHGSSSNAPEVQNSGLMPGGAKVPGSFSGRSSGSPLHSSGSNSEVIRDGFMNKKTASEVARNIGVSPSYVSRKYKELRGELTLTA